mmetsp:Transcript_119705/g.324774  ORF Transcript_119705/g.324774 Transcript_119705/m.324774 type:complete len:384 (-) Transcript_119705:242-1393(-)
MLRLSSMQATARTHSAGLYLLEPDVLAALARAGPLARRGPLGLLRRLAGGQRPGRLIGQPNLAAVQLCGLLQPRLLLGRRALLGKLGRPAGLLQQPQVLGPHGLCAARLREEDLPETPGLGVHPEAADHAVHAGGAEAGEPDEHAGREVAVRRVVRAAGLGRGIGLLRLLRVAALGGLGALCLGGAHRRLNGELGRRPVPGAPSLGNGARLPVLPGGLAPRLGVRLRGLASGAVVRQGAGLAGLGVLPGGPRPWIWPPGFLRGGSRGRAPGPRIGVRILRWCAFSGHGLPCAGWAGRGARRRQVRLRCEAGEPPAGRGVLLWVAGGGRGARPRALVAHGSSFRGALLRGVLRREPRNALGAHLGRGTLLLLLLLLPSLPSPRC